MFFKLKTTTTAFILSACTTLSAQALDFSATSLALLNGSNYEVGRDDRTVATIKHVNKWKYGDTVFFTDITEPFGNRANTNTYTEFSPRFSFGKILDKDLSTGPITDWLVATTVEMSDNRRAYLAGIGTDWKIKPFDFFQVNAYMRDNRANADTTWQVTTVWQTSFNIKNTKFTLGDAMDYSGQEGSIRTIFHAAPQLLADIGPHLGLKKGKLFTGVEYEFWRNKIGIKHANEDNAQFMVKWFF